MRTQLHLKGLILIIILINALGMLFPGLSTTFTPWYGSIAKHIIINNDWINLTFAGQDWLDKPHLPFWLTALSFKIFGINTFAYILPGFLFNLIGAYYTYRLARELYDENTALISMLIYVSIFHLMTSAIDIRAEAFLLGEIIPACYYWLMYDRIKLFTTVESESLHLADEIVTKITVSVNLLNIKYLFLGAFFTGLALMTKGIFVIITIMSGLACVWIYRRQFSNFIRPKWLIALALCLVFAIPELLALYWQFDLHPEKVIFGHTHVSGVKFFFWDSQFGRFFSTGPIASTNPQPLHQLFFIHTLLWAFLPWWPIFFVALWKMLRNFKQATIAEREKIIFLLGSFFITFILFSLSTLQVDHYTNIIFPFAAIVSAQWLCAKKPHNDVNTKHPIYAIEKYLAYLLIALVAVISCIILQQSIMIYSLIAVAIGIIIIIYQRNENDWSKTILFPTIAIAIVFVFFELVNGIAYAKYDAGYQIANYLNQQNKQLIVDYHANLLSLEFHTTQDYERQADLAQITQMNKPFYLVIKQQDLPLIQQQLPTALELKQIGGTTTETFLANLIDSKKLDQQLNQYIVLEVR